MLFPRFSLHPKALFANMSRASQLADGEDVAGLTLSCSDTQLK